MEEQYTEAERPKKTVSWRNILILTAVILFVVCLIGAAVLYFYAKSKLQKLNYVETSVSEETGEPEITILEEFPVQTEPEDGENSEDDDYSTSTLVEEEVELPEGEIIEDEKVLNILLVGTDYRSEDWNDPGRADVTMLCSINKKEGTVKLISFERGIMVPIPGKGKDLLTHSYVWGGIELLMQDIEDCFLLKLDGYMHVDFDTFQEVIDAIGGVDIELTDAEYWALKNWDVDVSGVGVNHLDGFGALRYCRLRKIDSNFGRIGRQRNTIQAILDKTKTLSLSEINDLADTVLPLIETDLEPEVFLSLLAVAPKFIGVTAEQYQVPEGNNSALIDFSYEAERINNILYGENAD